MRKLVFWLLTGLVLLLGLTSCGGEQLPDTAVCDFTTQTAVTLNLRDENGNPQRLARVRYRLDEGPWQAMPERVNGTAVLRDGPGTYQIQVEKPGYAPSEITIIVPEPDAGDCELVAETAVLPMSLAVCPDLVPANLEIELVAESEAVTITAVTQPGGRQTLTCTTETSTNCTLALPGAGELRLIAEGLEGIGPLQVNDGRVSYLLRDNQLTLRQNNLEHSVTVSGADSLSAVLDVVLDEVGCPLADFRTLEIQAEPNVANGEPFPALHLNQLSNLTITNLGAAACQNEPQPYPVLFEATLPSGTALAEVAVQISTGTDWQSAACEVVDGRFLCTAMLPNPLINQPYAYKIVAGAAEQMGSNLPFDNLCLLFE